ncbi:MAG: BTAD domain-containing putative transcriptional regulator, partial [Fimbriimonas sp.]|nr:BTAD domain-containing putative transcriptional regulator [Fimbriimonas sp.]
MPISEGPNIHVRLLGQISVQVGMVDVRSFRSNRVPALLGFLITQPGPHLRQAVAQTLWPNATEAVCRHNLRQTLLYLRSILGDLGDRAISASRSHLGLLPGILASDVDLLLETERYQGEEAKIRACEDAVRHAIGPFLPGIDDDWIRNERAFLSQTYLRALLFLADVEMEHSPAKALEYAERAVNEEPLMDGARARKISALVRLGEGVAAQLEFESFAELLDNELGITPSDIVRDALNEPAAVSRSRFVADRPNVKSDIAFALDTLGLGDRPNLAVELAIATTPHWIAVGTPSFGIERLREAIDRCGDRLDEATRCSAMVSIAELSLSKGDHESVERIVMDLRRRSGGLPDRVHVKALSLIAWVHLSRFDGTAALTKAKAAIAICETLGDSSIELDALRLASTAALAAMDFAQASAYAE